MEEIESARLHFDLNQYDSHLLSNKRHNKTQLFEKGWTKELLGASEKNLLKSATRVSVAKRKSLIFLQ